MELIIEPGGSVRCIYDEAIDLAALGQLHITRASHVEPDEHGHWWADMSPVGGPKLGPFRRRSVSLSAEQNWLKQDGKISIEECQPVNIITGKK